MRSVTWAAHNTAPRRIIDFDDIAVMDIALSGIGGVNAHRPLGIAVFNDTMLRDIIQPVTLVIVMRMVRETRVRADQL